MFVCISPRQLALEAVAEYVLDSADKSDKSDRDAGK